MVEREESKGNEQGASFGSNRLDSASVEMKPTKDGQGTKRQKTSEEGLHVEDRISSLPDDIIYHILSFVTPTKYAIRTSVLSRRWEHLWALSPKLDLEYDSRQNLCRSSRETYDGIKEIRANMFTHSIDSLLYLRDCLPVETFKLKFRGSLLSWRLRPISWICAVVMCNVSELDISFGSTAGGLGELPWCLFTCKTLVVLKLFGKFVLDVPHYVCLPNLKTLCLGRITYLGNASIQKFLSGCPLLEDLEIERYLFDHMWILNVGVSSLKKLILHSHGEINNTNRVGDDRYKIVLDTPNLEFIDLENSWSGDILLKPLPNIVEAHVSIAFAGEDKVEYTNQVLILLQSIVNVRRLFLSQFTLDHLSYTTETTLPTFCNLVQLELGFRASVGPLQLMSLLRSSPKLEELSFPEGLNDTGCFKSYIIRKFRENKPGQVPECLRHSLKTIQIKYFVGEDVGINIVEYLLENAMMLEKMTIFCYHSPKSFEFVKVQRKLTNYPRLSTDCQLDFIPHGG